MSQLVQAGVRQSKLIERVVSPQGRSRKVGDMDEIHGDKPTCYNVVNSVD